MSGYTGGQQSDGNALMQSTASKAGHRNVSAAQVCCWIPQWPNPWSFWPNVHPVESFQMQLDCNCHLHLLFCHLSTSCSARKALSSLKALTSVSHGWSFDETGLLCGILSEKTKTAIKRKQIGSCYGNSILC